MTSKAMRISALIRTLGLAQRAQADAWVRQSGLTRAQAVSLGFIEENQERGVIAREVAEMSGTTPASVASLLQGLEERGYLTRSPSPRDSRVKLLRVTQEGSRLVSGFDRDMRAAQERVLSVLSPAEQGELIALLERVATSIDTPPHAT
jgi:MarR family transcriptional regulator, repressor for mepA